MKGTPDGLSNGEEKDRQAHDGRFRVEDEVFGDLWDRIDDLFGAEVRHPDGASPTEN